MNKTGFCSDDVGKFDWPKFLLRHSYTNTKVWKPNLEVNFFLSNLFNQNNLNMSCFKTVFIKSFIIFSFHPYYIKQLSNQCESEFSSSITGMLPSLKLKMQSSISTIILLINLTLYDPFALFKYLVVHGRWHHLFQYHNTSISIQLFRHLLYFLSFF